MTPPISLRALLEAEARASSGQWNTGPETGVGHVWVYTHGAPVLEPTHQRIKAFLLRRSPSIQEYVWEPGGGRRASDDEFWRQKQADAGLIAAARNAVRPLCEALQEAIAALEEVSKGKGEFSFDQHEHAVNCVENAKTVSAAALAKIREKVAP